MCLIIDQPAGNALTESEVADIYSRNRDGFGAIWIARGRVETWRGIPRDAADAWRLYQPLARIPCVLHWRMATHGPVNDAMAHPFDVVEGRIAIVHNGVLSGFGSTTESDTAEFVRTVLQPAAEIGADIGPLIQQHVTGSAIVVVTPDAVTRYGRAGLDHAGRWYSNTYAWSAPTQYRYPSASRAWLYDSTVDDDDDEPRKVWSGMEELWDEPQELLTDATLDRVCEYLADVSDLVDGDDEIRRGLLDQSDPQWQAWCAEQAVDELQVCCAPDVQLVLRQRRGGWMLRVVPIRIGRDSGFRGWRQ